LWMMKWDGLGYVLTKDSRMFEINVTGVFMTAQAVAKHMIASGRGGSIVLIGSMSGTVANRVSRLSFPH
jgi:NAD(P)-dependent dehydrogenase (short-subunit alcohol dehydrogenase family)